MQKLAAEKRGGVQAFALPELLEFMSTRQEHVSGVLTKYVAGEVPIHAVAHTLGWTLAEIFHVWASENRGESVVIRHRPLLTRFGGLPSAMPGVSGRVLRMDISALLLAADLDILDVVEKTYKPIRVSRYLPVALFEQQRRLSDAQPSRVETYERMVALFDGGKIRELTAEFHSNSEETPKKTGNIELDVFLSWSVTNDSVFVEQLPITDHEIHPIEFDEAIGSRIRDLPDLLFLARRDAVIDDGAYGRAAVGLRSGTAAVDDVLPAKIVLSNVATSILAGCEALAQLADHAEVYVSPQIIEEARASIKWSMRRQGISAWLDRLRERVRSGLERGVYVTTGETDPDFDDPRDLDFETLRDILDGSVAETEALWIEDRACSRLGAAVVGVADVLIDLRSRGQLDESTHSALLHRLRAADIRYLPLDRDVLIRLLTAARTRKLPDSKELQTLARSLAAYALDGNRGNGRTSLPEIQVVLDASRMTASVVPELWKIHAGNPARALQHASWFMTHLYAGRLAVRAATDPDAAMETVKDDIAFDLAQLFLGALIVAVNERPPNWEGSATAGYVRWVSNTFAHRRFFTDPDLVESTGKYLAGLATEYETLLASRKETAGVDALLAAVFILLPDDLQRSWLAANPAFGEKHGLVVTDQLHLGGVAVPTRQFWAALERAVAGKKQPKRAAVRVAFDSSEQGGSIRVEHGEVTHRIDDPVFVRFAHGGAEACGNWSEQGVTFFDLPRDQRHEWGVKIGRLPTARERVMAADSLRENGGQYFYGSLRNKLDEGGTLTETAFQLSAATISDHLRWSANAEQATMDLILDVGIEETLRRISTLPVRIPETVLADLADRADAVEIVRGMARDAVSPLSVMHAATVALHLSAHHAELGEVGVALVDRILDPAFAEGPFAAFERAYAVVNSWMSFDPTASQLQPDLRLLFAMSHAGRLLDVMGAKRVVKAIEFFTRLSAVPREFLSNDPELLDHVLYPNNLSFEKVVVFGLCVLLRDLVAGIADGAAISAKLQGALKRLLETKQISGFLEDNSLCHGATGTIFDGEVRDTILAVSGSSPFLLPTVVELRETTSLLLRNARRDVLAGRWWLAVGAIVQHHPLATEDAEHVRELAAALSDETTRGRFADRDIVPCISLLASQAAALQDSDLRERVGQVSVAVAREFGSGKRDETLVSEVGPAFLDISRALSARVHDPAASARELASNIDELVRAWPAVAYYVAARASDLVWTAPAEQSLPLWRVLLRGRENMFRS